MIKYAIEKSLIAETKYKDCKELLESQPKQWYKNFIKDVLPKVGSDNKKARHYDPDLALISQEIELKSDQQQHSVSQKLPVNKREVKKMIKTLKKQKHVSSKVSDKKSETCSEFEMSQTSEPVDQLDTQEGLKRECRDELQELLETGGPQVQLADKAFLEPFPVFKKKITAPPIKTTKDTKESETFCLDVPNQMDLSIRKDFTPVVKFVDFKSQQNLENELYAPAQMQKKQEAKQIAQEDEVALILRSENTGSPLKSQTNETAASSEIGSSQISLNKIKNDKAKGHFIKLKQSHCNIKRECGVSYVRKTESKQENVRSRGYERLPPIVIQGSYTLPKNNGRFYDDKDLESQVSAALDDLFFNFSPNKAILITAFDSHNETNMKNYLLKPHKRLQIVQGKFWLVRSSPETPSILDELWRYVKDKHFLCIHLVYDTDCLVRTFEPNKDSSISIQDQAMKFIAQSDICLGFLPKKGNASVKSMLKVYGLESHYANHMGSASYLEKLINCQDSNIQGINTVAYLSRLELYVPEKQWKEASMFQKGALTSFINNLEDKFANVLLNWNKKRTQVYLEKMPEESQTIRTVIFNQAQILEGVKMKNQFQEKWKPLVSDFSRGEKTSQESFDFSFQDTDPLEIMPFLRKGCPVPITLINTRDCFAYDLKYTEEVLNLGKGREKVIKKEYYFDPEIENGYPANYKQTMGYKDSTDMKDIQNLKVGVTCYENFYTPKEMDQMEDLIMETEQRSFKDEFLPMTAQKTFTGVTLKRTKFFFGYRYMWTRVQLQDPLSNVAAGVRADVSQPPLWMKNTLEEPLVSAGVIDKDFVNSVALNVYHDGSEGLAQHFDDATRFKQPIFTLRLFSDSRLSFGSQYYGFQNSAFTIPLPRGCICKMEEASYSANGVKHCVRPCDMTGKSAAVILRQMHPNVIQEANKLDRNIDLPMWMSTLSLDDNAMPFYQQKEKECEWLERVASGACASKAVPVGRSLIKKSDGTSSAVKTQKALSQPKTEIELLMDDMLNRVEVKAMHEYEISRKIVNIRAALRSASKSEEQVSQDVKIFQTTRVPNPEKVEGVK